MKRVLWLHAAADPVCSGELRRLGVPAVMVEAGGWSSTLLHMSAAGVAPAVDLVVCPLRAADALSRLPSMPGPVLIELDSGCVDSGTALAPTLHALSNRIAGVVCRSPRVAYWAERALGGAHVPSWTIPDVSARSAELRATAMRFGLCPSPVDATPLPPRFELWFSEPGDAVSESQASGLRQWLQDTPDALVIAPPLVRAWASQLVGRTVGHDWSSDLLERAIGASRRCVFFGQPTYAQLRRRTTALRSGGTAVSSVTSSLPDYTPVAVGEQWSTLLDAVAQETPPVEACGPPLLLLDLVQDVDLALPIIDALLARRFDVRVAISGWLQRRSPRAGVELAARGIVPEIVGRDAVVSGAAPDLSQIGAVISLAESSLPAHERAHALFLRAKAKRLPTFSVQHGVENVGLSRVTADADEPVVASDHLFVWFPPEATPAAVEPALRPRIRHVGRSVSPPGEMSDLSAALSGFRTVAAVFENLHWDRYDRAWRTQFLSDCLEFAAVDPQRCVVLKPHHAGMWSTRHTHLFPQWPQNLVLADPADPFWEPFTAPSLLRIADLVVTTPSTVALDAVEAGKRVAIAAYGLDLPAYAPLPLLHSLQDWLTFASEGRSAAEAQRRASFAVRTAWGDRSAERMVDTIADAMRERAAARRFAQRSVMLEAAE